MKSAFGRVEKATSKRDIETEHILNYIDMLNNKIEFNTYDSCLGCPYRCSGSNPRCPYSINCLGCHGKCPGYQTRSETRQKENDLRRISYPDVNEVEFNKRLEAKISRAYAKRKLKEQIILRGVEEQ